jgi:hypothetical protein
MRNVGISDTLVFPLIRAFVAIVQRRACDPAICLRDRASSRQLTVRVPVDAAKVSKSVMQVPA